jgi:hypothetical protein
MTPLYHKFIDNTIHLLSSDIKKLQITTYFNSTHHGYGFQKRTGINTHGISDFSGNSQTLKPEFIASATQPILSFQQDLEHYFTQLDNSSLPQIVCSFDSNSASFYKKWIRQTLKLKPDTEEFSHIYRTCWMNIDINILMNLIEPENKNFVLSILSAMHTPEMKLNREFCLDLNNLKTYCFTAQELKEPLLNYLECYKSFINKTVKLGVSPPNTTQIQLFHFIQSVFPESEWQVFHPYLKDIINPKTLNKQYQPDMDSGQQNAFIDNNNSLALITLNNPWTAEHYPHLIVSDNLECVTRLIVEAFNSQAQSLGIINMSRMSYNEQKSEFLIQSLEASPINKLQFSHYMTRLLELYDSTQSYEQLKNTFSKGLLYFYLENQLDEDNNQDSVFSSKMKI